MGFPGYGSQYKMVSGSSADTLAEMTANSGPHGGRVAARGDPGHAGILCMVPRGQRLSPTHTPCVRQWDRFVGTDPGEVRGAVLRAR